jgi:manganese efflux pump family protein
VSLAEVFLIAVGLAADAFAVSLGAGASGHAADPRAVFRLSYHFGLFQFLMPVIGWYLGAQVAPLSAGFDVWIAFGLLAFVGTRMIYGGLHPSGDQARHNMSRGWTLIMLCVATSIDALAIGLSLAMLRVTIWYPSLIIGVVTSGLSLAGIHLGRWLGSRFGSRMEIAGGVVLWLIGLKVLLPFS